MRVTRALLVNRLLVGMFFALLLSQTIGNTRVSASPIAHPWPWAEAMGDRPALRTLAERFPPPSGFVRVRVPDDSFGSWLRRLPIREDRRAVHSRDGGVVAGAPAAGVVWIDLLRFQECADTAIRLWAEYLWQSGDADEIVFHFTSGDPLSWKAWRRGLRVKVSGSRVERVHTGRRGGDRQAFRGYLEKVFAYASTRSMHRDTEALSEGAPIMPGDLFVQPRRPVGHAIVVADVAEAPDGRRVGLVVEGYMPVQEPYVARSQGVGVLDGVWFVLPSKGGSFEVPPWGLFHRGELRRFRR